MVRVDGAVRRLETAEAADAEVLPELEPVAAAWGVAGQQRAARAPRIPPRTARGARISWGRRIEGGSMRLLWTADWWGRDFSNGYTVHSRMMRRALEGAGVDLVLDKDGPFDLAIHFAPVDPAYYHPIRGARNVLFTMVESTEPTMWHPEKSPSLLAETAALVVPSKHSQEVLRRYYSGDIFICPEGCDPVAFPFYARSMPAPDQPFRFVFVGQTYDLRKGHHFLIQAWKAWAHTGLLPANAELCIKTTKPSEDLIFPDFGNWNGEPEVLHSSTAEFPRVTLDARNLPLADLVALYNHAHVFVLPSMGEGWALTLSDAASTGAPCIYVPWSGPLEFMDETVGIPVPRFTMAPLWGKDGDGGWRTPGIGEPSYSGALVDEPSLVLAMLKAYMAYPEALARGRRASERMHSQYTWRQAAEKFIRICEECI